MSPGASSSGPISSPRSWSSWPVLSIDKLGRGQEGYYLQAGPRGVENDYRGWGESPGG